MKISYGKLAAIALLALMALAPILSSISIHGVQYPAGKWRVAFLTLGAELVPAHVGMVYLYNTTGLSFPFEGKVLISWAPILDNGIATFIDLPGDVWDAGFGSTDITYAIQVNFTFPFTTAAEVTDILILPLRPIVDLATSPTPQIYVDPDGHSGLGAMLNLTTVVVNEDFHWTDEDSVGDPIRPGFWLHLAPIGLRPVDEAGFPLVGAGVEMIANVTTGIGPTEYTSYSLDAKIVGGAWGSEFDGNMPVALPNNEDFDADGACGWVSFLAPSYFADGTTGLYNLTFIVRYKSTDPRVGPIVGRFFVGYIYEYTTILPTTSSPDVPIPDGPADTIPFEWYGYDTTTIQAYFGSLQYSLGAGYAYPYVWCNVRWTYSLLTDFEDNPWYTKDAEKWLKWAEGPVGAYMYVGVNVAPGLILLRFPDRLWNTVPLLGDLEGQYLFHLTAGVEWHFSIVNHPVVPFAPDDLLDGYWGYREYYYGATPGPTGDFINFYFNGDTEFGIGMEVEWCEMYRTEIKLDSSTEVPQALRNDIALTIILPAGVATNQNTTIAWTSSNTGYVILPDTEATRHEADPYFLWAVIGGETEYGYYHYFEDNVYGWLPSIALGHTNFIGWYQGVKVLDTTVSGGYPAGNLPPVYMGGDWYWNPEYTYIDWPHNAASDPDNVVVYKLAIYEMGFVLEFTPAPNGDTRPVPWYAPFFFTHPTGRLIGPTVTQPALAPWDAEDIQTYGIYELVKAAPGGSYSNFFIVWKGAMVQAINTTTGAVLGPITLSENMANIRLVFPVYDLNVTVWSQDPFKIVGVDVRLRAETDFSTFGLPYYVIREITDSHTMFSWASLPWGATYFRDSTTDSIYLGGATTTTGTGFELQSETVAGTSIKWVYWTEFETTGANVAGDSWQVLPAMFTKLPKKTYDIWVRVPGNDGREGALLAMQVGFRSVDQNKTLYWSEDPYPGVGPLNLTGHMNLALNSYVYNPNVAIKDAGGEKLPMLNGTNSGIFLVEPWYNDTASVYEDFYYDKVNSIWNPYFLRANWTDANGEHAFHSVNASQITLPTDPDLGNVADKTDFMTAPTFMGGESRFLIGKSTFQSAPPYRFMVYYMGVLVFNESIPLQNPYVSKDHDITTSVYPYIFKVTNTPLPDEAWRFGIQNLDVDVYWAGLNLTWWPSFSLVTETAVKEFSLLNASKLQKSFNMSVVERLWHWVPAGPITLVEIPYTPVPPYFSSALFVKSGLSDVNGEFKTLVPVWNYSFSNQFFTYMRSDVDWTDHYWPDLDEYIHDHWAAPFGWDADGYETWTGGPRCPWVWSDGPLGINLQTWADQFDTKIESGFFGTAVYANWTTVPGVTNNIPTDEDPRLAATLESAAEALGTRPNVWRWTYSVNATGLVNPASYYGDTEDDNIYKSLNTTSRAPAELWGGIGMLSGGVFQGRQAVDVFEDTVVGPPQPYVNFYAKLQVMAPVNDLGMIVTDLWGNDLPNQYVEVWDSTNEALLYKNYTPMTPTAKDGWYPDELASQLIVRSIPTNMLWGFYEFQVFTTNCTQIPTHNLQADWQLDLQWLHATLPGGDVDWTSDWIILEWPSKLQVTVYAGDASRYLHKAWVFIVDGVSGNNVTAALTDDSGYPCSLDTTAEQLLWQNDALATSALEGTRVNLGFNLWHPGDAVVTDFDGQQITINAVNKHVGSIDPILDSYPDVGTGKWIVKVFWQAPDVIPAVKTFGPVTGVSVWDTFRDQPQHRYIYLGILPPDTSTGEDYDPAQVRTFNTKVYDLKLKVLDQSPSARAIASAPVTITATDPNPDWVIAKTTSGAGEVTLNLVPAGQYQIVASSPVALYGKPASQITASVDARVIDGPATIQVPLPIFDATVTLVTPSGKPIVGASITVGGVSLGMTDAAGNALAASIPSGSYSVTSSWYGQDISPAVPLTVTLSRTYLLTASKIALVQIQVVGAQNQGLPQAAVTIKVGTTTVFTGMANNDGVVAVELPYATYNIKASHKGVEATQDVAVTGDTVVKITTGVFIELFGQGLTFAGFALWVIAVIIVVLILVIAGQEYNIYRRKRLPQLFGAGPTR